MSNANFDRLCKVAAIKEAREILSRWQEARNRTDLTEQDIEFLDRQIVGARKLIEERKQAAEMWWC